MNKSVTKLQRSGFSFYSTCGYYSDEHAGQNNIITNQLSGTNNRGINAIILLLISNRSLIILRICNHSSTKFFVFGEVFRTSTLEIDARSLLSYKLGQALILHYNIDACLNI